jgi:HAD-hyrolase-like
MAAEAIPAGAREFEEAAPAFEEAAPEPSTGATIIGEVVGSFILSFLGIGIGAAAFVSGQFARGDSRVCTATLLGHAQVLPTALARRDGRGDADIGLVMGDMGGTMYDDDNTAQANLNAIRELTAAGFDEREFWRWALEQGGASPERAVHVGNRLDSDIRPVKQVGMRAVWLLRGEAPPAPTLEQLSEPTAVVTSFSGLPSALAGMATSRVPAGAV